MIGNSKIINTLEKFYSVLEIEDPTEDEKMLVRNIEIDFAKIYGKWIWWITVTESGKYHFSFYRIGWLNYSIRT